MGIAKRTVIRHTDSESDTVRLLLADVGVSESPRIRVYESTCHPDDFGKPTEFEVGTSERRECELSRECVACGLIRELRFTLSDGRFGRIMTNEDGTRGAWIAFSGHTFSL